MYRRLSCLLLILLLSGGVLAQRRNAAVKSSIRTIREVNSLASPDRNHVIAIVGATLVDGQGGPPIADSAVVIRGDRISAVGPRVAVRIPQGAEIFDAKGLTLVPGLIDAHFHLDGDDPLPGLFLSHGVTSVRDPGQWIEAYSAVRAAGKPIPRLFLTGPHLDSPPPAYPADSYVVRDVDEARAAVIRFVNEGASAIKIYFRLPLGEAKTVIDTAHGLGVPVTAHLEILNAADVIRAGIDGIEHVTSFGTALVPLRDAEKYRQSVLADNNARREGRYTFWNGIDLNSQRARYLFELLAERGTFVTPTLAVFERRTGDKDTTEMHVRAFEKMLEFTGRARKSGVHIVVGSHSDVPHAERGWAYQRELELLVESGLSPMQAIVAGTIENARFFRAENRLGSIERGKLADLVLVAGDPLKDISAMRNVKRVMINGRWVDEGAQ